MTAIIDVYKNVSNDVSTFYVDGSHHVFLTNDSYYHNATRSPGGMLLDDFLRAWLVTNSSLDDAASAGALPASGNDAGLDVSAAGGLTSMLSHTAVAAVILMVLY